MKLLWIRYTSKQQSKHGLFMVIEDKEGNLAVLKSSAMSKGDINRIRTSIKHLEKFTTKQRIEWLKRHCPESYRKAFRKLQNGKYKIISKHQPK